MSTKYLHAKDCHCNRCIGAPAGLPSEPIKYMDIEELEDVDGIGATISTMPGVSPAGTSAAQLGPASEDRQAVPILDANQPLYRVACPDCGASGAVASTREGVEWARNHYQLFGHVAEGVKPLILATGGLPVHTPEDLLREQLDRIEQKQDLILALHRALAQGLVELGKLGPLKMISGLGSLGAVLREVDHAGSGGGPSGVGTSGVVETDSQGHSGRDPGPAGGIGGS